MIINLIQNELRKIVSFAQKGVTPPEETSKDMFANFPPHIRNALKELGVDWKDVEHIDPLEENIDPQNPENWKRKKVIGVLDGQPITISIKRDPNRNDYTVKYGDKEEETVHSLDELKAQLDLSNKGDKTLPQIRKELYNALNKSKNSLYKNILKFYLYQITPDGWQLDIYQVDNYTFMDFYVPGGDKKEIETRLKEHDSYRLKSIAHYIRSIAKELKLDVDVLKIEAKPIKTLNKAGLKVTIK